jgi:hypothetical protein
MDKKIEDQQALAALAQAQAEHEKNMTQVEKLLKCVEDDATLFHAPDGTAYANASSGSTVENLKVESAAFTRWISGRFYLATAGSAPSSNALTDARQVITAKALYEGEERQVWRRVARSEYGSIFIDLGRPDWSAIRVDSDGWSIYGADTVPVEFIRGQHTGALPIPSTDGGNVSLLKHLINVEDDEAFKLILAWLIQALKPEGPYPVLDIQGEQGSAKSGTTRILYSLVDPSTEPDPLRDRPRDEHSLAVAARNNWCLAYDNLSHVSEWLSDAFCRLSTGGAFGTRKYYSDNEETLLSAKRPVILNSITGVITRPDLQDRAIVVEAPYIEDENRRSEEDIKAALAEVGPLIFAGLLDGLVATMKAPARRDKGGPRMIDFIRWATPALDYLSYPGLEDAYRNMRADVNAVAIEFDAVASALIRFMADRDEWEGTTSDLLRELEGKVDIFIQHNKSTWPQGSKAFGWWIKKSAPVLRAVGLQIIEPPRVGTARKKHITWLEGANRKRALAAAAMTDDDGLV